MDDEINNDASLATTHLLILYDNRKFIQIICFVKGLLLEKLKTNDFLGF